MTTLEIVWRNPNPVRHHSRRRKCKRESNRTYYILEEFVVHGNLYSWTTISALEMLPGGEQLSVAIFEPTRKKMWGPWQRDNNKARCSRVAGFGGRVQGVNTACTARP
ncbi:MAG: hypothetical protein WB762_05230 [Candidatus Sulfotelmatobacter sp.]